MGFRHQIQLAVRQCHCQYHQMDNCLSKPSTNAHGAPAGVIWSFFVKAMLRNSLLPSLLSILNYFPQKQESPLVLSGFQDKQLPLHGEDPKSQEWLNFISQISIALLQLEPSQRHLTGGCNKKDDKFKPMPENCIPCQSSISAKPRIGCLTQTPGFPVQRVYISSQIFKIQKAGRY